MEIPTRADQLERAAPWLVRSRETLIVLATSALAGVLLLKNLGDQCLWQDEAQTALIAKTILTDGIPRGCDERNFFSQDSGSEYWGPCVYRRHTWLPFYLVAGSFAIFGVNTFAARLPFALLGLATVPLVYATARALWQSRRAAALSAILLATSVPFLLLSRQCRYYSVSAFFMLLAVCAYHRLTQRRPWSGAMFLAASVLLFHAFYVYWGVLVAAVVIHAAMFRRDRLAATILWSFCSFLLALPWLLWIFWPPAAVRPQSVACGRQLAWYLERIFKYAFSPVLIVAPLLAAEIQRRRKKRFPAAAAPASTACKQAVAHGTAILLLLVAVCIAVLTTTASEPFFRYLAPLLPVLCMVGGRILAFATRVHVGLGAAALALAVVLSPLPKYLYEITHHYRSSTEGIVEFLNARAAPDDVVAITYGDLPLKFYTNLCVVGGLTGEDLTPALHARWIIRHEIAGCRETKRVADYLATHLRLENYRRHVLDCPDLLCDNRECPDDHRYWTATDVPAMVILERPEK